MKEAFGEGRCGLMLTLASGLSPLQPQWVPSPLATLWLPGPAGGGAGSRQLQGSGPEGIGVFGPQGPVRGGRSYGGC